MSNANTNNKVAKELSDAMARCKQQGIDEQSLRTGLLTITIANFVNRIGMGNTVGLFEALPEQITSGIFDRYIDPNTNTPVSPRAASAYQPQTPMQPAQPPAYAQHHQMAQQIPTDQQAMMPQQQHQPQHQQQQMDPVNYPYQNSALPQNFVPPYPPQAPDQQYRASINPNTQSRRRLTE